MKKSNALLFAPVLVIITALLYIYHFNHYSDQFPTYFQPRATSFPYRLYYVLFMVVAVLIWLWLLFRSRKEPLARSSTLKIAGIFMQLLGVAALIFFMINL